MGKLVKFGEYFYKEDPSTTLENIVDRFLNTNYLSKKNIDELSDIGISKDIFLKIYKDVEFYNEVRNLLYDREKWDLFKVILFDLEVLYDDGVFNFFSSDVNSVISSNGHPLSYYKKVFDEIRVRELDFKTVLVNILKVKNQDRDGKLKNWNNSKGCFNIRKANWFDIDISLELKLTFEIQSIYKNTSSFGYEPFSTLKKRASNILSNDVMFKFLKIHDIDKFDVSCKENYSHGYYQTFDISVKRTEKSAEQSADFLIMSFF